MSTQAIRPRGSSSEFVNLIVLGALMVAGPGAYLLGNAIAEKPAAIDDVLSGVLWLNAYVLSWLLPFLAVALVRAARTRPDNKRLVAAAIGFTLFGLWLSVVATFLFLIIAIQLSPIAVLGLPVPVASLFGYLLLAIAASRSTTESDAWSLTLLLHGTRSGRATVLTAMGVALAWSSIVAPWVRYSAGSPFGSDSASLADTVRFGVGLGVAEDPTVSAYAPNLATLIALVAMVLAGASLRRGRSAVAARTLLVAVSAAGIAGHLLTTGWVGRIPKGALRAPAGFGVDSSGSTAAVYDLVIHNPQTYAGIVGAIGYALVIVGLLWPSKRPSTQFAVDSAATAEPTASVESARPAQG